MIAKKPYHDSKKIQNRKNNPKVNKLKNEIFAELKLEFIVTSIFAKSLAGFGYKLTAPDCSFCSTVEPISTDPEAGLHRLRG